MIVVAALITIVEGKGDEFQGRFKELATKVRKEPGAITYVLHRMIDNPEKFFVFEQWENEEALKLHGSTAYFKEYRQATAGIVKSREVGLYRPAG